RDDILSVAGPEYAIRCDLFDFVVAELRARESACPHRIRPVRTLLENQRDNLLAFAVDLDRDLTTLAQEWQISVTTAREVLQVQFLPTCRSYPIGLCGPAVWSKTSTADCEATSSCGGTWGRTT